MIYEVWMNTMIMRKLKKTKSGKEKLHEMLIGTEEELMEARKGLQERLDKMDDIPALEQIGD